MPKSKSVNPPKESHINPTLGLPGFHAFGVYALEGGLKTQAYKDGTVRPSPYGEISNDIFAGAILTGPKLTNDQPWKHRKPMPYAPADFNYPRKDLGPGVYPQPATSLETERASNPETATLPNEYPYPVMTGILEAQMASYRQDAAASEAARVKMPEEKPEEFRERLKSPAELYYEELKKKHDGAKIGRMLAAGYTEDEIRDYLQAQRMRDITRHAEAGGAYDHDMAAQDLVAGMFYDRAGGATGFGAVGIGANSADAVHPILHPVSVSAMLRQDTTAKKTGGSVAALQLGGGDPRSAVSYATPASGHDTTIETILARQQRPYRRHADEFREDAPVAAGGASGRDAIAALEAKPMTKKEYLAKQKAENAAAKAAKKAADKAEREAVRAAARETAKAAKSASTPGTGMARKSIVEYFREHGMK